MQNHQTINDGGVFYSIINYVTKMSKKNIFVLFSIQQSVLCFARALRFCGFTQSAKAEVMLHLLRCQLTTRNQNYLNAFLMAILIQFSSEDLARLFF